MKSITLAQGGGVPVLGFGTWQITGQACTTAVENALDIGYRHIDTAQIYGNEQQVGEALASNSVAREKIFLTTKVWRDAISGNSIIPSVEASLKKLQTEYVDLLLIHWPQTDVTIAKTLESFVKLKQSGKVKNIGVSNFNVSQMQEAVDCGAQPVTNQVEYHPLLSQQPVIDFCRQNNMFVTAYSPLAQGEATHNPVLMQIGLKYGKTAAQVCLRWLVQQENVVAIPKASSRINAQANFDIFDFELDAADLAAIASLPKDRRLCNPSFAPLWDKAAA